MDWRPAQDRRRPWIVRWGGWAIFGVLAIVSGGAAAILLLPFAARTLVRAIEAAVDGFVWVAMSLSAGMSLWSVLRRVVGTLAALMMSPAATIALAALVIVGVSAAYGLQKILGSEEESSS